MSPSGMIFVKSLMKIRQVVQNLIREAFLWK